MTYRDAGKVVTREFIDPLAVVQRCKDYVVDLGQGAIRVELQMLMTDLIVLAKASGKTKDEFMPAFSTLWDDTVVEFNAKGILN